MPKLPLILSILAIPTVALAQGLPTWNIEIYCAKRAQKSGMTTSELLGACVEAEQASLAELKDTWSGYSSTSRAKCLKDADPHYGDLEACVVAADAMKHKDK
jgi:hypothetical protein